jgi:serine protease
MVVVAAAGNNGGDAANYAPANCAGVITVAATNRHGGKAYYSNTGSVVAIAAPGGDSAGGVLSTHNTGTTAPGADSYAIFIGTSQATPHVAGTVSLMLSVNPSLTTGQVRQILQGTARAFPTGAGSDCSTPACGAGIVDAGAAVAAAKAAYMNH